MNKKIILGLVGVVILGIAYYGISPLFVNVVANDAAPIASESQQDSTAENVATDTEQDEAVKALNTQKRTAEVIETPTHPASGQVTLFTQNDMSYVRYENFKTLNGPDLFVYLSTDLKATDYVNLGKLRATEGNINYLIPKDVDVKKYKYVLVWCKQFGVLFNYADISGL
jgi:hypothetical protein